MINIRVSQDKRRLNNDSPAPLKIVITKGNVRAMISIGMMIDPKNWDAKSQRVINHPRKNQLNSFIEERRLEITQIINDLRRNGKLDGLAPFEIKNKVLESLNPEERNDRLFIAQFDSFVEGKVGRTKEIYIATRNRLYDWLKEGLKKIRFEDISVRWLEDFDVFLAKTSPSRNARNIHFRNIRAVFNRAIDNEITTHYPFRRFKLRPEPTRKRNFSAETIRDIITADKLEDWQVRYRDFFALIFMLIGINVIDLCGLKEIRDGRVDYIRAKTHKPYSIKVEPEAMELINKYKGKKFLLSFLDTYNTYRSFYNNLRIGLRGIKDKLGLSDLTTYWARHSWATIAASLDIPKETIAAALGHGGNTVTDIYIDFDQRKVDEANRRVLDWVLYGKK